MTTVNLERTIGGDLYIQSLADKAISDARDWLEGINRSLLGSYAGRVDDLSYALAYEKTRYSTMSQSDNIGAKIGRAINIKGIEYRESNGLPAGRTAHVNRFAEVYLWLERSGGDTQGIYRTAHSEAIVARMYFYRKIITLTSEIPGSLPYVEVGILDADAIWHCIKNDIDPEMALAVNHG